MSNKRKPAPAAPNEVRRMSGWDHTAILLLGAAGFAFSYDSLRQVAIAIHAKPSLSWLFPVFIDGFIAYGVRALVLLRHSDFRARLYAWTLFFAATGSSLWANALHAITLNRSPQSGTSPLHLADWVVGVLSMLAPLALAGSVHLYIIMARTAESSVPDGADDDPGPVRDGVHPESPDVASARLRGNCDTGSPAPGKAVVPRPEQGLTAPDGGRDLTPSPDQAPTWQPNGWWWRLLSALRWGRRRPMVTVPDPSAADEHAQDSADRPQNRLDNTAPAETHPGDAESAPSAGRDHGEDVPGEWPGPTGPESEPSQDDEATTPTSTGGDLPTQDVPVRAPEQKEGPVRDGDELPEDREVVDVWMKDLVPLAREACRQAGRISRDVIKDAVRAQQPISNDRLGELLAVLRAEEQQDRTPAPAGKSSALW
ncbi:DUF2637 domain-containing protein [Streptomyces sp. UNOC14_S4]|uniref:DUF2637 domain-containing protein n=1 Tax=Streptomyces sp. UNOC14_S4 TaxID=2872340 RepID=UPI001E5FE177|nr:DUF2637 domain-containing protein [Streptomyces sp. UNOC14_S4]